VQTRAKWLEVTLVFRRLDCQTVKLRSPSRGACDTLVLEFTMIRKSWSGRVGPPKLRTLQRWSCGAARNGSPGKRVQRIIKTCTAAEPLSMRLRLRVTDLSEPTLTQSR